MPNDLEFAQVCSAGTDALSIWWIDDCFTNKQLCDQNRGGYLPMSHIHARNVSCESERPSDHYDDSGLVYAMLCSIAKSKGMNFCCSSFEYARDLWSEINVRKYLVLVDIGYEGFSREIWNEDNFSDGTFGIDFLQDMLKGNQPKAVIVYLTIDQRLVTQWIRDKRKWIPGASYPIRKLDQETSELPEIEINALVDYFISQQPRKASEWTAEEYKELRRNICNYCKDQDNEYLAHHWPGGTEEADTYLEHVDPIARLCELPNGLPLNSPHFKWGEAQKPDIYSIDRPPIRALATFDHSSEDLLSCLKRFLYEFESECNAAFRFQMDYPDKFTEGCLWFNASALCRGILNIGIGFKGIVLKKRAKEESLFVLNIAEQVQGTSIELTLTIAQYLVTSENQDVPCPLPNIVSGTKKIREAYEYFRKSGFGLHIENESLLIKVVGEVEGEIIWQKFPIEDKP